MLGSLAVDHAEQPVEASAVLVARLVEAFHLLPHRVPHMTRRKLGGEVSLTATTMASSISRADEGHASTNSRAGT